MSKRLEPWEMPDWPRRMSAKLAAAYLGISESKLHSGVKEGRYPSPIADGGNRRWDRKALDLYVDQGSLSGDDPIMAAIERIGSEHRPKTRKRAPRR